MAVDSIFLFSLVGIVALFALYRRLHRTSSEFPLPPGPPPEFIVGNFRQVPKVYAWKTYLRWAKQYNSDIISYTSFGKRVIVLNSAQVATDLLDKRGSIYSERDHNVMIQDLMGVGDDSLAFMQYGDKFRLHRKLINTALNPTSVRDYSPIQEKETYALLERLLDSPEKWRSHLRRTAGSTILTVTYGHPVTTDDDYLITLSEASVACVRQAIAPTSFLVNLLPSLKHVPGWLPGVHFKKLAKEGLKLRADANELPWKEVKAKITKGIATPSYTTKLLDAKGTITGLYDEEKIIKHTAGVMYGAGSDTSTTSVTTLILALMMHPDVQKKAQAEIDAVIGNSRLPTFADQDALPYLQCVIAESLRWNPVTALGIPHAAQQDDVYNGMFIPKGSVIITNIWAMLQDERMYTEPSKFWPERFDGRFPNIRHPRALAFGFNRRLCPGRHLALNGLFIQAANLLAVYNFSKSRDENGNEIEPLIDYGIGPPKPFKCVITPRSEAAVALIRSAAAATAS